MGLVTNWDDLTAEEYFVMLNTMEQAYLHGVIADYLGHSERCGAVWVPSGDEAAIEELVPTFRTVVHDLIERDLVEIREPGTALWDNAPELDDREVTEVLADPASWIKSTGSANRMIMLMPTPRAERLLG